MSEHPHLPHAPIVEALIDFRVEADAGLQVDELNAIQVALGADSFPEIKKQTQTTATFQFGAEPPSVSKEDHIGFALQSADRLHVVQVQRGGFTFSRLRPYVDWDQLVGAAKGAWDQYVRIAKPRRVTRIAVRTLNRIELPIPTGDLRQWVRIVPDMPEGLPQSISEMFVRFVVPVPAEQAVVILTETLPVVPATEGRVAVILDLDVVCAAEFSVDGVWAAVQPLRSIKNKFFFECVTPQTLDLFR
jgi:uncharacterized protein (TIGR04255 family)